MKHISILILILEYCRSAPINAVLNLQSTTQNPYESYAMNAEFLDKLPPEVKEGMQESLKIEYDGRITKEDALNRIRDKIKKRGNPRKSDDLLINVLSALMDYSLWYKEQTMRLSPGMRRATALVPQLISDKKFLSLTPKEKEVEVVRLLMYLRITKQDSVEMMKIRQRAEQEHGWKLSDASSSLEDDST